LLCIKKTFYFSSSWSSPGCGKSWPMERNPAATYMGAWDLHSWFCEILTRYLYGEWYLLYWLTGIRLWIYL